jgi:O-antigen ligase
MNMWKTAFVLWREHPYFGAGWLHFPRVQDDKAIVPGKSVDLNHAHSNYLQFLGTTGIVGEIAYLWLLVGMVLVSIKSYVRAKVEKDTVASSFYAGTLAGMVSLMVSGLFEFNFGTAQVRMAQWFILALLSYEAVKAPSQEKGTGPKDTVPDSLPSV